MNAAIAEPAHPRLARVRPAAAALATRLLAALDDIEAEGERVRASTEDAPAGGWLVCDTLHGSVLLRPGAADVLGAAVGLGAIEPLVAAVERALDIVLVPVALVAQPAPDAVTLRLDAGDWRLWLALAPDLTLCPVPQPIMPPADTPIAMRVMLGGPALPAATVAHVSPGDLLLLPVGASASLTGGGRTARGRLTPLPACLAVEAAGAAFPEIAMDETAPLSDDHADIPVALGFALDGVTLPWREVAGLAPGAVVPLGAHGRSLPVRVVAGGQTLATGELVAFGDGYAVRISARNG